MSNDKYILGKPIVEKEHYYKPFYKLINGIFNDLIFKPLFEILKPVSKYYFNDNNIIIEAIRKGQIQYINGKFYGKFNAQISKELIKLGAKFNHKTKTYDIKKSLLPLYIRDSIAFMSVKYLDMAKQINYFLDNLEFNQLYPNLEKIFKFEIDKVIDDLELQAKKTLAPAFKKTGREKKKGFIDELKDKIQPQKPSFADLEEDLKIIPDMDEKFKEQLRKEYIENVNYSISKFTHEATMKLRQMVQDNLFKNGGLQVQSLVDAILKEFGDEKYGMSPRRAEFIARQDTGLLIAKFRKIKYTGLGINEYIWKVSKSYEATKERPHGVRPYHWKLKDTRQNFNNPPIVNKQGDRKNPTEDFNCHCEPLPIIEYKNMI